MSVWETFLVFGLGPLGGTLVISLLAARKGLTRRPRYRPGEPWNHQPVWWTANPEGAHLPEPGAHQPVGDSRGGAHGDW